MNKLYNEKNEVTTRRLADGVVDCIVTDPPYGYSFMGKDWDKAVPSVEIWRECYRVMKPGAFAFIMSAPRQDVLSHMIINLEAAGFDTSFSSIYWAYASGFPKAMNMAKAIDKKLGEKPEITGEKGNAGAGFNKTKGFGVNTTQEGETTTEWDITKPVSDEAKAFSGSYGGFQPKPAVEIIIVVMKPLSQKTYTDQALDNAKGVTWLDDCRVPYIKENKNVLASETGRFPANLIVSDDILNDGKVYGSGDMNGAQGGFGNSQNDYGNNTETPKAISYGDVGSFSRFFDVDNWWDERIKSLPEEVRDVFPFLIQPKAAKAEKNFGITGDGKFMDGGRKVGSAGGSNPRNFHPTVKPIRLMSYLITLGSRPGDVIYDPFAGTGTTLISAKTLGRHFLGSECDAESFNLAQQRLAPFISQQNLFND